MLPSLLAPVAAMLAATGAPHAHASVHHAAPNRARTQRRARAHHARYRMERPKNTGRRAVRLAKSYLQSPYVWGGESYSGVDCSGLVVAVYRKLGAALPHNADALWHTLPRVRHLRSGDLVAFGSGGYASHIGIYAGHDRFVNAVGAGRGVQIGRLHGPHGHANYLGAVRPQVVKRVRVLERPAPQAAPVVPYAT
jgi:cell wall-associated NlpC family hydrolase